jgi:diguanylate cyclase (GGDEF)-like protein/PAS domain S-box-containing protein
MAVKVEGMRPEGRFARAVALVQTRGGRLGLTALLAGAFLGTYPFLYHRFGAGVVALLAFPIIGAGIAWGIRGGVVIGLLALPVTTLVLLAVDVPEADLVIKQPSSPVIVLAMAGVGGVVGRLRELSRQLAHEAKARRRSDLRYRDLFENAHDIVFTYDLDCRLTAVNAAAQAVLGYSRDELLGMDPGLLIPGDQWERLQQMLADCLAGTAGNRSYEIEWQPREGDRVVLEISPLLLEIDGRPAGIQGIARDVTERRRTEAALRHQALHDPLTGLANRVLLSDRLDQALKQAARLGDSLAVLILDVDDFKAVNDTFGHQVGDELLREIGVRLRASTRETDTIARMGGDEFGILLPGLEGRHDAEHGARRLIAAFEEPLEVDGHRLAVGASLGIALYPEHGDDAAGLLRRADVALYAAKRAARRSSFYATEDDQFSPRRLALRAELREAIENDGLEVHFQPKVACATARVVGVEALVRWRHPEHGLMAPDQFIPIAEHSGLIAPLTGVVLRRSLAARAAWAELGWQLPVAINLSPRQLHDRQLPDTIATLLSSVGATAGGIQFELTESAVMADVERALDILGRLERMGVKLSIDDFGTGYSSLSHLRRLPVAEIKIDKSFVLDLADNRPDRTIVRGIVDLGHNLGLSVAAEGVQNEETLELLTGFGCDVAQGHHLGRPMPAAELAEWLRGRAEDPATALR